MSKVDLSSSFESTRATVHRTSVAHVLTLVRSSQGKKKRQHGNDAIKSHILAARTVATIVKTSLVVQAGTVGGARANQWRRAPEDWTRS